MSNRIIEAEIKCCAHCGSKENTVVEIPHEWLKGPYDITQAWVRCDSCMAHSGAYRSVEEAIQKWNMRTSVFGEDLQD